jgi:hypothetical protein
MRLLTALSLHLGCSYCSCQLTLLSNLHFLCAGIELLLQDFISETDGGVLHNAAPSVSYFEANNMAHDILQVNPRALLQQRVSLRVQKLTPCLC